MNLKLPFFMSFNNLQINVSETGNIVLGEQTLRAIRIANRRSVHLFSDPDFDWFDTLVNWYYEHLTDGGMAHPLMEQIMIERRMPSIA
ncbi:MAG: hypothetical protein CMF12_08555 [Idiomarina sp.]|nr:hypothetical protein [Idiomarina sp.]